MLRKYHIAPILFFLVLIVSCTSPKNTAGTRWYHSFNTRYNVYFNGEEAYKEALKTQQENYTENYSEMIYMFPVSASPKDKQTTGGSFDKAIEKSVKAIKTHSIKTKPEKSAGKRNDPQYKEFMSREEYNPFLHNAWMLMAKSQFYNGDFLQAASSFSYISRHYASQPEIAVPAKLWQARSYAEMGWFYEAEDILSKINNHQLSKKESELFATIYADFLVKQKLYKEAVPYLQLAIKAEKNKFQRARMSYLQGQIYTNLDQNSQAYHSYEQVIKSNPPYLLEFNARIRQTEVYPGGDHQKVTKVLQKMAKSSKNKDYLDQVYYAMGNVYMSIPDTAKAIESYELGVEKSTANGLDKALCQIKLGDIYFQQRNYVKAQPNYSEALSQLKKEDKDYERVSKRSEALDELVIHYEAVQLQDSLQRLSRMTEPERLAIVHKIIDDLKKKEEEEKKKAERENYLAEQEAKQEEMQFQRPMGLPAGVVANTTQPASQAESFYFYNTQVVASGKSAFQQKWGRRRLEDDWRRRNKANPMSDQFADTPVPDTTAVASDTTALAENDLKPDSLSSDPHDPQYYLQQIPVTEEEFEASDLIIIDGLFNMGLIYKDKLEDYSLAIESLNTLNTRFPDNENKLMSYYNLYLIYLRQDNKEMAELYKSKIRSEFPESDYAVAMADPDYEYNLRMMDVQQDSIYQQTYQSYLDGNASSIRKNYEMVKSKYSQSKLMPKFMFLNALSYVMTHEADTFKVRLKELIDKYPEADVSVLAGEMMKGFQRGLSLATGDGNLARGTLFNMRLGSDSTVVSPDSTIVFSPEVNTPHMLMLIYPKGSINENMLLYMVAEYNFGNFMVNDFDLQFETFGEVSMLQIKGFNNYNEVIQYWKMINKTDGYAHKMGDAVVIVPISLGNYDILIKGKSLQEYITFFEAHWGEDNVVLIDQWKGKQEGEAEQLSKEEEMVVPVDLQKESEKEAQETVEKEEIEDPLVKTSLDQDSVIVVQQPDSILSSVKDSSLNIPKTTVNENAQKGVTGDEVLEKAGEITGKASKTLEDVQSTINEIAEDPIRGIGNLFQKRKKTNAIDEYVKQQEKEEKERQQLEKKEREEKEKADRALAKQQEKERKEFLKKQAEEDKRLLKEKKQREEELEKEKRAQQKQEEQEKERLKKEKADARKLKEQQYKDNQKKKAEERKAKEKADKEERDRKEKERKEAKKIKDAERKAEQKRKAEERKAKEKAYQEAQKQKQKEREEARKQREAEKKNK